MPLKLNVGLSRKIADNNYGSRGANVNVEMELDSGLITEPAKLQERIRQLFGLVRTSLVEELNGNGHSVPNSAREAGQQTNARSNGATTAQRTGATRQATQSQVKALFAITKSQRKDLNQLLRERFQVRRADDLTIKEASQLIDELKSAEPREG